MALGPTKPSKRHRLHSLSTVDILEEEPAQGAEIHAAGLEFESRGAANFSPEIPRVRIGNCHCSFRCECEPVDECHPAEYPPKSANAERESWNGSLFVGGRFTTAGGKPSKGMARWDDVITAVEVQDLEASTLPSGVQLRWRLSADAVRSVTGVEVQRAGSREGPYQDVTSPALTPETWMTFVDATAQPGVAYWYRLVLVLGEGSVQTAGPIAILANSQAWETKLYPPRIEGGAVELRYTIGTARTSVQLEVFDTRGRLVRTVASGIQELGQHSQFWDARNNAGSHLARGVYLVHLITDRTRATQKLVLLGH